ncbi:YlaI family protein [Lederbergia citri]|uniref:YlaI family protein n=1 Tax=Lederbergia citri TaxID=2833580 RepID=A0A942YFP4_9BACI|nr:YlaI family protein [Lederbergia citri]MBS4193849.1 YlaI family protein [Lederbergia citri]
MRVKCVLCDKESQLDDDSSLAKKLRNRPIHTYMCQSCHERIKTKTEARIASGSFQLYSYDTQDDDF